MPPKRSKRPAPKPEDSDAAERAAMVDVRQQGSETLQLLIARFRNRLDDPDYRPTPSDIVGTLQALRQMDDLSRSRKRLRRFLREARKELKALNDALFSAAAK